MTLERFGARFRTCKMDSDDVSSSGAPGPCVDKEDLVSKHARALNHIDSASKVLKLARGVRA